MCYLCETGALTTMREFSQVHFQAMGEAVPVGDVAKEIDAFVQPRSATMLCIG